MIKFWVSTLPLINLSSSLSDVTSDLLTFLPSNLNCESLGYSFKFIVINIVFPTILSNVISMLENNPWSQSLLIAFVILIPGISISFPISSSVIAISVLLLRLFAPSIIIPPSSYFFGVE